MVPGEHEGGGIEDREPFVLAVALGAFLWQVWVEHGKVPHDGPCDLVARPRADSEEGLLDIGAGIDGKRQTPVCCERDDREAELAPRWRSERRRGGLNGLDWNTIETSIREWKGLRGALDLPTRDFPWRG